jgi:hypothetical protein
MLALSTSVILFLVALARRDGAGDTADLSRPAIFAVILGGIFNTGLLTWFRSGQMKRLSDRTKTVPAWRPALVASILVLIGWAACLVASYWLGLSWSRR